MRTLSNVVKYIVPKRNRVYGYHEIHFVLVKNILSRKVGAI